MAGEIIKIYKYVLKHGFRAETSRADRDYVITLSKWLPAYYEPNRFINMSVTLREKNDNQR